MKLKDYPAKIVEYVAGNAIAVLMVLCVAMVLFMVASNAKAVEQDHTCQGGHNCNEGGSGEQTQSQDQSQSSTANSTANSTSTSSSGADSNSSSSSNSGGNSLSSMGGESSSSSTARGGSAEATGGVATATSGDATGGKSQASSGGNSQDIYVGGDTHEAVANTAATVFAGYCQSGASAQIDKGGFSVVQTEQFCQHLRLANMFYQAYERELRHCSCVGVCTVAEASVRMECSESGQAAKFLDAYYENIWDANQLVQTTEGTAWVDRVSKQLSTPLALIGAFIWLL
jgi:hypothetical protein